MGTLKPTLTLNDVTTFSDPINFSVDDELNTTAPAQSLSLVSVDAAGTADLVADAGADGTVFTYVKNTNTSGAYSVDLRTVNGTNVFGTLDNGEFAFIPVDANEGLQVLGVGGTVTVEYAYWTKG